MADNQRRVRDAVDGPAEAENDDDIAIIETDETAWILVGEIWVDVARIVTVGPLYISPENPGERPERTDGVSIALDLANPEASFIHDDNVTPEEVMELIARATGDFGDDDDEDDVDDGKIDFFVSDIDREGDDE